jgi:homogentisate 1,2-dioxygenase
MDTSLVQANAGVKAATYRSGFGNEHASEALAGALPIGRNSPQRPAYGLYAEQLNGTAFTAPRSETRRTWLFRIRPSADHGAFVPRRHDGLMTAPLPGAIADANRLAWDPWPMPDDPHDFVDGILTIAVNGNALEHVGIAIHVYTANRSMRDRVFASIDGELLIIPQEGALRLTTELGILDVAPGEIALVPRSLKFAVELLAGPARGYICENYGTYFRLPELGPIGANGLANARDFLAPTAAFEDRDEQVESLVKFGGTLWTTMLDHSPFDVVAWHGTHVPLKYDLARFMAVNTVSFDHADPSIFTVLHAPSGLPGVANVDFVIFPPRWSVAEGTFRPPYFHRNVMAEFSATLRGRTQTRGRYAPGGCNMRNPMAAHGPDIALFESASAAPDVPVREEALAIMFESRLPLCPTPRALAAPNRNPDFDRQWIGMPKRFRVTP